jgi:hypothetical protein
MGGRYASQVQSWGGLTILQALLGEKKKEEEEEEEEEEVVDEEEEEGREEKVGMEEVCSQLLQHVIEQAENFSGVRTIGEKGGREGGREEITVVLASRSPLPPSLPPSLFFLRNLLLSASWLFPLGVRKSIETLLSTQRTWRVSLCCT